MIEVFEQEIADGIAEVVKNSTIVSCVNQIIPAKGDFKPTEQVIAKYVENTKASQESIDLYPMTGILVSTGWNKNDEIFDPVEVWLARHTPENKPFNYEHMGTDIIGHITGTYPVDDKLKLIAEDTKAESLPNDYHIVNNSVLYKYWRDPDHMRRAQQLIEEIEAGEWFLSMEAFVPNFDYGLLDSKGNLTVVQRNKSTAGISKHLRVYGGNGVYNNCKVGRVLRNIVFAGKGLVRQPANENSVIFKTETVLASMEKNMAESVDTKETENPLAKTVEQLKVELAAKETAIAALTTELAEVKKVNDDVKAKLDVASKETETVKAELSKVVAEKVLADRTRAFELVGAGDEAPVLAAKFINLNDEQHKIVVEATAVKYAKPENKSEDAETVLANAKEKPDVALGVNSNTEEKAPIAQSMASFIVNSGFYKTLGKGNK